MFNICVNASLLLYKFIQKGNLEFEKHNRLCFDRLNTSVQIYTGLLLRIKMHAIVHTYRKLQEQHEHQVLLHIMFDVLPVLTNTLNA